MSLTSLIDCPDVKQRFKLEFKKPALPAAPLIKAPPRTKAYSKIGGAFDYLMRFFLQRMNPSTIERDSWVAESAAKLLAGTPLHKVALKIVADAKDRRAQYLLTGELTNDLLCSALSLADIDPIFRAGRGHEYIGQPHNPEDIEDLRQLMRIVPVEAFRTRRYCLLNPTFGVASQLVGGADADLVLDDTLVDFKCVIGASFSQAHLNQLLGYYVLHTLSPVGALEPALTLTHVAVYFARHAHFVKIPLNTVIDPERFPAFVEWFQRRAVQQFGDVDPMKQARRENLARAARK